MVNVTASEIWGVYKEAVGGKTFGGKTFDGKPMPDFEDCAFLALKGWEAVAAHCSAKGELDWSDVKSRQGRFSIESDAIEKRPGFMAFVLGHMVVVHAEFLYASKEVKYVAYSPLFEECKIGHPIPEYSCEIDSDLMVLTARRIEDGG